jgi:hypothetical protein
MVTAALVCSIDERYEIAMAMVTASIGSEPRAGGLSVWRKFLDAVVEPQPRNAEHEIISTFSAIGTICRPRYGLNSSVAAWAMSAGPYHPSKRLC